MISSACALHSQHLPSQSGNDAVHECVGRVRGESARVTGSRRWIPRARIAQIAAKRRAPAHPDVSSAFFLPRGLLTGQQGEHSGAKFAFLYSPRIAEPLLRPQRERACLVAGQHRRVDTQLHAEVVEDRVQDPLAGIGRAVAQAREPVPTLVVGRELIQSLIADAKQSRLLEVGLRHAPAATQILKRHVIQQADKRGSSLGIPRRAFGCGVFEEVLRAQGQCLEQRRAEIGVLQTLPLRDRRHNRGSHLGNLHEVVEVPRLQRRVLAVVSEAEDLALAASGVLRSHVGHECVHGDRRRCRPPGLRERRKFGEVAAVRAVPRGAAAQADHEWSRLKPALSDVAACAIGTHGQGHRDVLAVLGLHGRPGLPQAQPMVG